MIYNTSFDRTKASLEVISSEDWRGMMSVHTSRKRGDYRQMLPNCNNTRCRPTHTCAERQVMNCYMCPFHIGWSTSTLPTTAPILLQGDMWKQVQSLWHWKWKMLTVLSMSDVDGCFQYFNMYYQVKYLSKHQSPNPKLFRILEYQTVLLFFLWQSSSLSCVSTFYYLTYSLLIQTETICVYFQLLI